MHINLSRQALTDELGEPALTQQIMCTADISSMGVRLGSQNQGARREAPKTHLLGQSFATWIFPLPALIVRTENECAGNLLHTFNGFMRFHEDEEDTSSSSSLLASVIFIDLVSDE